MSAKYAFSLKIGFKISIFTPNLIEVLSEEDQTVFQTKALKFWQVSKALNLRIKGNNQ